MTAAAVRSAIPEDVYMLGIIGPAAYDEEYAYLWDRPGAYSEQLRSFGQLLVDAAVQAGGSRESILCLA